jgi:hypothetical protein
MLRQRMTSVAGSWIMPMIGTVEERQYSQSAGAAEMTHSPCLK